MARERELENEIKRALALSGTRPLTVDVLSPHIATAPERAKTWATLRHSGRTLEHIMGAVEREVLRETLLRFGGNKSKTARHLGISRNGLAMKMERFGLS